MPSFSFSIPLPIPLPPLSLPALMAGLISLLSSPPLSLRGARSSRTVSHSHTPARRRRRPPAHRGDALPADRAARPGWPAGMGSASFCLRRHSVARSREAGSRRWRPRAGCGRQWRRRRQRGLLSLSALRTGHSVFRTAQAGLPAALHMVRSEGGGGGRGCGKRRRTRPERSGEFFFFPILIDCAGNTKGGASSPKGGKRVTARPEVPPLFPALICRLALRQLCSLVRTPVCRSAWRRASCLPPG